jgi:hypothetical protein
MLSTRPGAQILWGRTSLTYAKTRRGERGTVPSEVSRFMRMWNTAVTSLGYNFLSAFACFRQWFSGYPSYLYLPHSYKAVIIAKHKQCFSRSA